MKKPYNIYRDGVLVTQIMAESALEALRNYRELNPDSTGITVKAS
jgi:hypothetical protein